MFEAGIGDALTYLSYPGSHHVRIRTTNMPERLFKEVKRRTKVVGVFPNDAALLRLAGMLLLEQNDEWLVGRRYLSESSMALVMAAGHPAGSTTTGTKEVAQLTTS